MEDLPQLVLNKLNNMNSTQVDEFKEEYERKKRRFDAAIFMAFLWLYYAYAGQRLIQVIYRLTGGGLWIRWFIDMFRISGLVKHYNKDLAIETIKHVNDLSK